MRRKIKALITRTEFNSQRNDILFAKKKSEYFAITAELETLAEEMQAINHLGLNLYPTGVMSKEKIFAVLRRQGVLKRKLADMKVQAAQLTAKRDDCEQQKSVIAEKRKILQRQIDKYQNLRAVERRKQRLNEARNEDTETEERASWQ